MIHNDILSKDSIDDLIEIALFEIKYFLCNFVPSYQSFPYMNEKYSHTSCMRELVNIIQERYKDTYNKKGIIRSLWFVVSRKDSNYNWHKHDLNTAVIYLKNTKNRGTIFKSLPTPPSNENSMLFIEKNVEHCVPDWKDEDRITIAVDIEETTKDKVSYQSVSLYNINDK